MQPSYFPPSFSFFSPSLTSLHLESTHQNHFILLLPWQSSPTTHHPLSLTMLCSLYNHNPCKAVVYKVILEGELTAINDSLNESKKRNHLYHCFVVAEHGSLGHHVHICIPKYNIAFIRNLALTRTM